MTPSDCGSDLRVAVVGYGLGGSAFHAPVVAATPGLRLAAIVTGDPARRAQVARDHPGTPVIDRPEHLWERAREFDIAVVTTPNRTHVPVARAALAAGLHVVVDKPFARTADEARALVEEARARGRVVLPFHNRRWDGDFLTVRRLIAEGELGAVRRFESRFERWREVPKPRWCEPGARENAEGILYDIATHLVDQALLLFGPVTRVYAETERRHPEVTVEDDASLALAHASGVRSHLHVSAVAGQPGPRFTVFGTRAAYVKHGLDPQEDALRAGGRPGAPGWGEEPAERWGVLGTGADLRRVRTEPGAYQRFYAGVVATVRDGAPSPVPPDDAIAGLAILGAALRSARERRVVAIGDA